MGTNYYRVNIPTEDDIRKMHQLIDQRKLLSHRGYWSKEESLSLQDIIDDTTKSIHICKISFGWQVNFDHNWGQYYQPNIASLEEFLKAPNTRIEDEYGKVYTPEQFWTTVKEHNNSPHNSWVSKTYREWERDQGRKYYDDICHEDIRKCHEMFGVDPESNDFEVDGLRFCVFSDFS